MMKTNTQTTIIVNDQPVEIAEGRTIAQLLEQLQIKTRAIAVELNHEIQPADSFAIQTLTSGDTLEIVTLVGGG